MRAFKGFLPKAGADPQTIANRVRGENVTIDSEPKIKIGRIDDATVTDDGLIEIFGELTDDFMG